LWYLQVERPADWTRRPLATAAVGNEVAALAGDKIPHHLVVGTISAAWYSTAHWTRARSPASSLVTACWCSVLPTWSTASA
jgi:hypothetical protein